MWEKNTMAIHSNLRESYSVFLTYYNYNFLTSSILKNKIEKDNFRKKHKKTKTKKPCEETL